MIQRLQISLLFLPRRLEKTNQPNVSRTKLRQQTQPRPSNLLVSGDLVDLEPTTRLGDVVSGHIHTYMIRRGFRAVRAQNIRRHVGLGRQYLGGSSVS